MVKLLKTRFLFSLLLFLCSFHLQAQDKGIQTAGDILLFAVPASALGTTLVIGDGKGSWQFAKSFLLNEGITFGLKAAINKPRPFRHGNHAFPSGHTSTTFQAASFIHQRYGFKYSIPAYLAAGYTAFSRLNAQKHDGWDILAGAMVGIGSTLLFTTKYERKHMEFTFINKGNDHLLAFYYTF